MPSIVPTRSMVYPVVAAVVFISCLALLFKSTHSITASHALASLSFKSLTSPAANATLGFERIFALSRGTEWRLRGLNAAASYTGLDVVTPEQPFISDEVVNLFMEVGPEDIRKPTRGSARAWIAHLYLLRHIVQSGWSSALIVEDDADWDVEIKRQMMTLSEKVREYTEATPTDRTPYGDGWDVLWLGHCGEWYDPNIHHVLSWDDDTAGPRADWRGVYDANLLKDLPEGKRHLFWSATPICTYAYAVTLQGAKKILEWASHAQAEAYDIHLSEGCRSGGLKCLSVVDQLFHHHRPAVEFGQGSDIAASNDGKDSLSANSVMDTMGSTAVILRSARCKALFDTTCKDTERPF